MSNGEWCCRVCRGPDGKPWRNWADKTHCHKCKVHKGKIHLAASSKPGCPTVSKRQGEQKRQGVQRDPEVAKLRREIVALQARLDKAGQDKPDKVDEVPTDEDSFTLEHYINERTSWPDGHPMAVCLDGIIQTKREERQRRQPQSVKLAKADKLVGQKRTALEKAEERVQAIGKQLKEAEELKRNAAEELRQAEDNRKRVVQELGNGDSEPAKPDKLVEDFKTILGCLQEADYAQAGVAPGQALAVFEQFGFLVALAKQRLDANVAAEVAPKATEQPPAAVVAGTDVAVVPLPGSAGDAGNHGACHQEPSKATGADEGDGDDDMDDDDWAKLVPDGQELGKFRQSLHEQGYVVKSRVRKGSRVLKK